MCHEKGKCLKFTYCITRVFFHILFLSLVEEYLRDEVEDYNKTHRGKELPGFVNYRTFEAIVRRHVQDLQEPAMNLLQATTGYRKKYEKTILFL